MTDSLGMEGDVLARLAEEQAAPRRVTAVTAEVDCLFTVDQAGMARFDPDETVTIVGSRSSSGKASSIAHKADEEGTTLCELRGSTPDPRRKHKAKERANGDHV
jgi:hypothetical protein